VNDKADWRSLHCAGLAMVHGPGRVIASMAHMEAGGSDTEDSACLETLVVEFEVVVDTHIGRLV
jgi:hypothetical protein